MIKWNDVINIITNFLGENDVAANSGMFIIYSLQSCTNVVNK